MRLYQQVEQLQQAVFRCAISVPPLISNTPSAPIRVFSVEYCKYNHRTFAALYTLAGQIPFRRSCMIVLTMGSLLAERSAPDPAAGLHSLYHEQEQRKRVLGWRRTHKDPFEGEWEQIRAWLLANPERSSGDIFRELQRLSPGRYHPLQIRTLQRGMRKIRAHLLQTFEEQWQTEVICGSSPVPISPAERAVRIS
jgi:hypothetical protein